jgi:hypothetical protein
VLIGPSYGTIRFIVVSCSEQEEGDLIGVDLDERVLAFFHTVDPFDMTARALCCHGKLLLVSALATEGVGPGVNASNGLDDGAADDDDVGAAADAEAARPEEDAGGAGAAKGSKAKGEAIVVLEFRPGRKATLLEEVRLCKGDKTWTNLSSEGKSSPVSGVPVTLQRLLEDLNQTTSPTAHAMLKSSSR